MLPLNSKNIQEFVINWNNQIPIDRWYRQKYNIPFNSITHKSTNIIDMFIDFYEYIKFLPKKKNEEENSYEEEKYIKGKGNFMKISRYSKKDIDKLFDELDIDNME